MDLSRNVANRREFTTFSQQYGFANFGRVFTVIHCETLSWARASEGFKIWSCHFMVCLDAEYSTCRDTVSSSQFMVDGGADGEADLGQFSGSHKENELDSTI